jgi:hypothetical protein
VKSSLIKANPFSVFTLPEYIGQNSAVILGKVGNKSVCSASAVLDHHHRLPLDAYFHQELERLRMENKKLIEIGLLANQREKASPFYIIELLSSIACFGVYSNFHDYVIGVHPRRAKFFKHFFGFHQVGAAKKYEKLNGADVILLHANGQEFETMAQKASHAIYFQETDLAFENRFRFIRLASLLPYKAVIYVASFFINLWHRIFPLENRFENQMDKRVISLPFNEADQDRLLNDQPGSYNFQSIGFMEGNTALHSQKEREEVILSALQTEYGLSKEELDAMFDDPFLHQY